MKHTAWWHSAIFYQIYPRSFADSNGDGIGDILGIIAKLDYLQRLGITALWLSPHYPSPQIDVGYDVADYYGVAPEYGTQDDFKRLVDEVHQRGMHLITDLVLNHTSDQCAWFIESKSSRENPKRDWYVWLDGIDSQPPNNWESQFGGSAWEFDPTTRQYYYHYFLKEQPDLNWRNPAVKAEMFNVVRYWLDMGVDGFRLDAIGTIFEDPLLTPHQCDFKAVDLFRYNLSWLQDQNDAPLPADAYTRMFGHQVDQPEVHELFCELRAVVDEYPDRILIGEAFDPAYLGDGTNELHSVFNFSLTREEPLTADWVRNNHRKITQSFPPGVKVCNILNHHDGSRSFTRYGDGVHNFQQAQLALATLLTLPAVPFLYNGEEIGMSNHFVDSLDQVRDYLAMSYYQLERAAGRPHEEVFQDVLRISRDRNRTPMQWANSPNAGFSPAGITTWLPVSPNYAEGINVEEQEVNPTSMLNFYRQMLALRQHTPALIEGALIEMAADNTHAFVFLRQTPEQTVLVALNYTAQPVHVETALKQEMQLLFSSASSSVASSASELHLHPFEIFLAVLKQP